MTEEIKDTDVTEEVVPEEVEQEILDEAPEVQEEQEAPKPEIKVSEKEENIKALRASRKQLQTERDAYFKRIQDLEAAQVKKAKDVDFDDDDFDDDPNKKEIKLLKQQFAEISVNNSRMKLQTEYPDFGKVVTEESISILKQRFPEIAATLDQSRDIYTTGVSAYNIIKKFGLHVDDEYVNNKENVESNINKPRPASSLKSTSALSYANDYSDLSNKDVRDEIIRIATERAANG